MIIFYILSNTQCSKGNNSVRDDTAAYGFKVNNSKVLILIFYILSNTQYSKRNNSISIWVQKVWYLYWSKGAYSSNAPILLAAVWKYAFKINPLYSGTGWGVLLQTVKTKMKCSIMLHFIRVYTICKGKKDLQTKRIQYLFEKYNLTPLEKCCMLHFTRVYSVCKGQKDLQTKRIQYLFEN